MPALREPRRKAPVWLWPAIAGAIACVPVAAGFSATKIFYIRDMTMFFWPRHLWIREVLLSGRWPLWDPYAAGGQPVFPDALNQLFLPPVTLMRVLLPPVIGFNLIAAAPFPLAAVGAWLYLRRAVGDVAATVGAIVFAASGPVVSTGNFPNLSWSIAWLPWMLWAADRDRAVPSVRRLALLAAFIALQMLSGEPVTMAGSLMLLCALAVEPAAPIRTRVARVVRIAAASAAAALVAAVQLVPMALAARHSPRATMAADNFWSVHPLWLLESMLPHLFGDTFHAYNVPWIRPLNSGRDPFFYSVYVGPVVLLLSALGALSRPRRRGVFWSGVLIVSLVCALGEYTPIYPVLQQVVPMLRTFRFPAKFLLFAAFALAALAAFATDALRADAESAEAASISRPAMRLTLGLGIAGAVALGALIAMVLVTPFFGARTFFAVGKLVELKDPVAGAAFLFSSVPPVAARPLILLITSALLAYLGWPARHQGGAARVLLAALVVIDLVGTNIGVNPVFPPQPLGPPVWAPAVAAHPDGRFYIGGKFQGTLVSDDRETPRAGWRPIAGVGVEEARSILMANLAMTPAPWHLREMLSYDLPQLWPADHTHMLIRFQHADEATRFRFLQRSGVRYCILGAPPFPGARPLQRLGDGFSTLAVYECVPESARAFVVGNATVVSDVAAQLTNMFDAAFPVATTVMLDRTAPAPAGRAGSPCPPGARIVRDEDDTVVVEARAAAGGGYLVLLDSFDPDWRATVDGDAAPIVRANAQFRAVALAPGRHEVRFTYHPRSLAIVAPVSALSVLALAGLFVWPPRRAERPGATRPIVDPPSADAI